MKVFNILILFLSTSLLSVSFGQSQDIHSELDKSLKEMSQALEDLDLNKLLNEDLLSKLDDIQPSEEQIVRLESLLRSGVKQIEKIDLSSIENMVSEMEKSFESINLKSLVKDLERNIYKLKTKQAKKI